MKRRGSGPPAGRGPGRRQLPYARRIEEAARWLKEVTGSHKQPYLLRPFDPQTCSDDGFKSVERFCRERLVRYRSAARKHQVLTESEKGPW